MVAHCVRFGIRGSYRLETGLVVVPIWKGKVATQECSIYRRVTFLCTGQGPGRFSRDRFRQKLLNYQCHEQSASTHNKYTGDRILALRVLSDRLRDFRTRLLVAYVDLRKAFDSVNRNVVWRILALRGVPKKPVNLILGLHSGTECCEV